MTIPQEVELRGREIENAAVESCVQQNFLNRWCNDLGLLPIHLYYRELEIKKIYSERNGIRQNRLKFYINYKEKIH